MNNNTIKHFESFLEKRNDLLDNLAYQLLWLLTQPGTEQTEAVLSVSMGYVPDRSITGNSGIFAPKGWFFNLLSLLW